MWATYFSMLSMSLATSQQSWGQSVGEEEVSSRIGISESSGLQSTPGVHESLPKKQGQKVWYCASNSPSWSKVSSSSLDYCNLKVQIMVVSVTEFKATTNTAKSCSCHDKNNISVIAFCRII